MMYKWYYITKSGKVDKTRGYYLDQVSVEKIVLMLSENFPTFKWGWIYNDEH